MTGGGGADIERLFGLTETGGPVILLIPVATLAGLICKLWDFRASGVGRHLAPRGVAGRVVMVARRGLE